jgi:hypothetical protein
MHIPGKANWAELLFANALAFQQVPVLACWTDFRVVADANTFCIIPDKSFWTFFRKTLTKAINFVPVEPW